MNPTFFLLLFKAWQVIWGAGRAFVIPTATSDITGQGKFSLGFSFCCPDRVNETTGHENAGSRLSTAI